MKARKIGNRLRKNYSKTLNKVKIHREEQQVKIRKKNTVVTCAKKSMPPGTAQHIQLVETELEH